jgi:hypothetical protein
MDRSSGAIYSNAQHPTGPSTPEGKAASTRNAVKHGFLAKVLPAEQQDYRELLKEDGHTKIQ